MKKKTENSDRSRPPNPAPLKQVSSCPPPPNEYVVEGGQESGGGVGWEKYYKEDKLISRKGSGKYKTNAKKLKEAGRRSLVGLTNDLTCTTKWTLNECFIIYLPLLISIHRNDGQTTGLLLARDGDFPLQENSM